MIGARCDAPAGGHDLGESAATLVAPPLTLPAESEALSEDLPDELNDCLSRMLAPPYYPKGWQRDQRHVLLRGRLGHDDSPVAAQQRQVGHADRQVPAFLPPPFAYVLERLFSAFFVSAFDVRATLDVRDARITDDLDLPGHAVADVFGERLG